MSILNQLLTSNGIPNVTVARKLGVSEATVRAWRTGRALPNPEHLIELAHMLNISPSKLMFGVEGYKATGELKDLLDSLAIYVEKHPSKLPLVKRVLDALIHE